MGRGPRASRRRGRRQRTAPAGGRRARNKTTIKSRIVAAALVLFQRKGFDASGSSARHLS
jgi:hypothetical protein